MTSTKGAGRGPAKKGHEVLSEMLAEAAASFEYPRTPDVSERVRQRLAGRRPAAGAWPAGMGRRLAWAAVVVLLLLASLLAVPQVRAALGEILRIGAMTVFVDETVAPGLATETPAATPTPAETKPSTVTAAPLPTKSALVIPATPVSLAAAREMVGDRMLRPAYPEDLGAPDGVYVDRRERPGVVVFVWEKAGRPDEARLSLYHIYQEPFASKFTEQVAETTVNGRRAVWIEGPHMFQLTGGSFQPWQFVPGPVLLWTEGAVTYRLEGAASLEEAVRIAESLE